MGYCFDRSDHIVVVMTVEGLWNSGLSSVGCSMRAWKIRLLRLPQRMEAWFLLKFQRDI